MRKLSILISAILLTACMADDPVQERPFGEYGTYYRGTGVFNYMPSAPDYHYVVFRSDMSEDVLSGLEAKGFEITEGPDYGSYASYFQDGYEIPDALTAMGAVVVHGEGSFKSVPGLIYSSNLYYFIDHKRGRSMTFKVVYDENDEANQIRLLNEYARKHNLIPMGKSDNDYYSIFRLLCTNDSAGNVLEMSNWFAEEGGFIHCEPDFMYDDPAYECNSILFLSPYCACYWPKFDTP